MNIEKIRKEFWEEIEKYDRFLLCLHRFVDMDSLCSNAAMMDLLLSKGKTVTLLAGENEIFPKNFEIFADEMKFVCRETLSGIDQGEYDCLIMLDIAGEDRLSEKLVKITIPKMVIDHHAGNNITGTVFSFIDPKRSSTAEMVAELGWIDSDDFKNLIYMGIYADTVGLQYNVSPRVHQILGKAYNSQTQSIVQQYEKSMSVGDLELVRIAIKNLKFITNKSKEGVSVAVVDLNEFDLSSGGESQYVISLLEKSRDIDVLIVVTHEKKKKFRLRIRSYIPGGFARRIAEIFGGSGHDDSAGASIGEVQYLDLPEKVRELFS